MSLYHGGVPGLRSGDLIEPGHARRTHDGCAYCEARANGEAHNGIDGPSQERGASTLLTTHRLYAKHYASLWGYGDLYRVEPIGNVRTSTEDSIPTTIADSARVVSVIDRAVLLSMRERRRLFREWGEADQQREAGIR